MASSPRLKRASAAPGSCAAAGAALSVTSAPRAMISRLMSPPLLPSATPISGRADLGDEAVDGARRMAVDAGGTELVTVGAVRAPREAGEDVAAVLHAPAARTVAVGRAGVGAPPRPAAGAHAGG